MQISEEQRQKVASALPQLGGEAIKEISEQCNVSTDTVYRIWRRIHGRGAGTLSIDNEVVQALIALAVKRKKESAIGKKRAEKASQQLSEL